jgi:hypothetical protein
LPKPSKRFYEIVETVRVKGGGLFRESPQGNEKAYGKKGGYAVMFSIDVNVFRANNRSSSGIYCDSQVELRFTG